MPARRRTTDDSQPDLFGEVPPAPAVKNAASKPRKVAAPVAAPAAYGGDMAEELRAFAEFGAATIVTSLSLPGCPEVPVFTNEYWTSKQRAAHSLHEISYRACFKPQLPRFFISRLTSPGDVVYDPFMGRGTTLLEAGFMGRVPWGCDINPVSRILLAPRLRPPDPDAIRRRISELPLDLDVPLREDLSVFYHPQVLRGVCSLREYFASPDRDDVDHWLRMVATNRLTGHSPGYFSVYTLPPNQAVTVAHQTRINTQRSQTPPERDLRDILLRKSLRLCKDMTAEEYRTLDQAGRESRLVTASCDSTPMLPDGSVNLVVTSPPFLNEVNYQMDNWLRCWFNGTDSADIPVWKPTRPDIWQQHMTGVLTELRRLLKPGGHVAFEVGEVQKGKVKLEENVIPAGVAAGLEPILVMINAQEFTKTAHCWGIGNQTNGTNTNRIILFRKPL